VKAAPIKAFGRSDLFLVQSNVENYQSACPWDIYSPRIADEMVRCQTEWPETT